MPFVLLLCCAAACGGPGQGPVSGASADPVAAAAATEREDWREAANRWYAVYCAEDGRDVRAIRETARALLKLNEAESAMNMLDQALDKTPEDVDLLELKAEILVEMGFRRSAENYYRRVLEKDPQRATALLAIGRARIQLGLEGSAVKPLTELVRVSGGDYGSYSLLARALKGSGDAAGAFSAWKKAFGHPGANLDDLLLAASLGLDADVRRVHPDATAVCHGWLEKAITIDPQCAAAHFQFGLLSEETGAVDAAIPHYRRAVELDPSCLRALTNLAILYSSRSDEPKTREMVQRALQFEVEPDRRRALQHLLDPFERKPDEKP